AEVGGDPSAAAKGGIEAAAGEVAGQGEVRAAEPRALADREDLAVGLKGHVQGAIRAWREAGVDKAGAAEGRVGGQHLAPFQDVQVRPEPDPAATNAARQTPRPGADPERAPEGTQPA